MGKETRNEMFTGKWIYSANLINDGCGPLPHSPFIKEEGKKKLRLTPKSILSLFEALQN
jgi:hypothetical protein